MNVGRILVPVAFAMAGFVGARLASGPPSSGQPAADAPGARVLESKSARPIPAGNRAKTGFAAARDELSRVEAAYARKDYGSLMAGEHANDVASKWAGEDPEGLWHWIEENGGSFWGNLNGQIFNQWFRRDPDAAVAALRKTRTGRYDGQFNLMGLLFDDDPEVALAAGERLDEFLGEARPTPGEPGDMHFTKGLETVEKLMALPDSHGREELLRLAVAGWFQVDWRAARDWAAGRPETDRAAMEQSLFTLGLPRGLQRDPEAVAWALEWFGREENHDLRAGLGDDLAGVIAREDPAAAMTWASTHLSGAGMSRAMAAVVASQLQKDREAAIATVDALPPGGVRQQAGRALVMAMMPGDPEAAVARALSDEQAGFALGHQNWSRLGAALAGKEPGVARSFLVDSPEGLPPVFRDRVVDRLASRSPEETLQWAAELEDDRGSEISEQVLRVWRGRDPAAAEKWERARKR